MTKKYNIKYKIQLNKKDIKETGSPVIEILVREPNKKLVLFTYSYSVWILGKFCYRRNGSKCPAFFKRVACILPCAVQQSNI